MGNGRGNVNALLCVFSVRRGQKPLLSYLFAMNKYLLDPLVCPSSLNEKGEPMDKNQTSHIWDEETNTCAECGTTNDGGAFTMKTPSGGHINYKRVAGLTCYHEETDAWLIRILEDVRARGQRIKITLGDPKTGKAWPENPRCGKLGRSTGIIKVPLLVNNCRSTGGEALLDHCIVEVAYANKKRGGVIYSALK